MGGEGVGERAGAAHGLVGVEQAPAVHHVDARLAQVGGRGQDGLLHVAGAHPRERLPHHRRRAGDRRGGQRGARGAALELGAVHARHRDQARGHQAPGGGAAAGVAVVGQAGGLAALVEVHRCHHQQVPVPFLHEARHQRSGGRLGAGVVAGRRDQQAVHVDHAAQPLRVALGLAAQVVLVGGGGAHRPVVQAHAAAAHVGDGVARHVRGAPVVVAGDAPVQLRFRGDAAAEAADRAAGEGRGHDRAVAVAVVFALAGVVAVPGHAAVEGGVGHFVLAVEQADLDALAGQAGLVRGERAGGHQQVVLHALVAVVAGLGRARAAAVGARQRVRLRRRGRLAGLGRLRRGGSCRLGGSRRVGLGFTAATAGRQGQGQATVSGARCSLDTCYLTLAVPGCRRRPGEELLLARAGGGDSAAARTGGIAGCTAWVGADRRLWRTQCTIPYSGFCRLREMGQRPHWCGALRAPRRGRLRGATARDSDRCGAAGAGAAGVGTQGGGEPGRREPGGGSAGGASSKGAARGRGGEEPGAPTRLARCQGGTARARPDGRGAGGRRRSGWRGQRARTISAWRRLAGPAPAAAVRGGCAGSGGSEAGRCRSGRCSGR